MKTSTPNQFAGPLALDSEKRDAAKPNFAQPKRTIRMDDRIHDNLPSHHAHRKCVLQPAAPLWHLPSEGRRAATTLAQEFAARPRQSGASACSPESTCCVFTRMVPCRHESKVNCGCIVRGRTVFLPWRTAFHRQATSRASTSFSRQRHGRAIMARGRHLYFVFGYARWCVNHLKF